MNNIIYRVYDQKERYHQSYSGKLKESYEWAVYCANSINGKIYEAKINEKGETLSSALIFPKNGNKK